MTSEEFSASLRAQAFLTYIVHETVEGRADGLKGTTVAQDVFEKGADFDPNQDSIVRVHARRLRAMLRDYYLAYPGRDPVVITMPKGGYKIEVKPSETTVSPAPEARLRKQKLLSPGFVVAGCVVLLLGLVNGRV